jgi:hypothetical protein
MKNPILFKILSVWVCLAAFCVPVHAQTEDAGPIGADSFLAVRTMPAMAVPLPNISLFGSEFSFEGGTYTANPEGMIGMGGGGGADMFITLPPLPFINFRAGLGYTFLPLADLTSFSVINASAGIRIAFPLGRRLSIGAGADAGYYISLFDNTWLETGPYAPENGTPENLRNLEFYFGVHAAFRLTPVFSIQAEVGYRELRMLTSGISASVGVGFHIPSRQKFMRDIEEQIDVQPKPLESLAVENVSFSPVYPVFYHRYDDHSIGTAVVTNKGSVPVENIKVTFFEKQFMNNPKTAEAPAVLAPGESAEIKLYGLFTDSILRVSEGTKVSSKITVTCTADGKDYINEYVETIRIYDRNALTWDDDRKAAAFVTAKDSEVLSFSKNIRSALGPLLDRQINTNFTTAAGVHETLSMYGITYTIDPTTPYEEFSKDSVAVDFLQFPRQTLRYKAGDCDDLSVLYCALLESVGVPTAFITVPGHIYIAVDLGLHPEEARRLFRTGEDLIFLEGTTWLPLEVTMVGDGFLEAWAEGAKEWRRYGESGQAALYEVREAWKEYEPVALNEPIDLAPMPPAAALLNGARSVLTRFAERTLQPLVETIEEQLKQSSNPEKLYNRLGVAYAGYGLYVKAEEAFLNAVSEVDYGPALVNLGNVYFIRGKYDRALDAYERAEEIYPENPKVILALARTHHEIENYGFVSRLYEKLAQIAPELAERYDYLTLKGEEAERAASASQGASEMIWEEEEDE